jgi:polysaccharide export outer membrane protein
MRAARCRVFTRLALVVSLALGLGPGAFAAEPPAELSVPIYRFGPRDLVRIRVQEVPELNVESRVSATGTISLPLLGDFFAAGFTEAELAARLEGLLEERYVKEATVSVEVLEARSRPITLVGSVRSPGSISIPGRWTLLDVLVAAGGLGEGHGGRIFVLRRADNELFDQITITVDDLLLRGLAEVNIPIQPGDLLNIPSSSSVVVYLLGAVGSPGEVRFANGERITLFKLIVRGGGLRDTASNKIRIKRRQGDGFGKETVVNYKRILAGLDPDPEIFPGDVVTVKESFF